MKEIVEYRQAIDDIDDQIRMLFVKRMDMVKKIADYKMAHDLTVYDSSREDKVIARNLMGINSEEYLKYYEEVLHCILKVSKEYQKSMIMGSIL